MISIRPSQAFATAPLVRESLMLRRLDARHQESKITEVEPHSPLKFDPPKLPDPTRVENKPAVATTPQLPRVHVPDEDASRARTTHADAGASAKFVDRVQSTFDNSARGFELDARS
jgi:hypothetical protein